MRNRIIIMLIMIWGISGCGIKAPLFSLHSYEQTVSLKVEVTDLMSRAGTPYEENLQKIEAIKIKTEKAYEFAKGRPDNEISTAMWKIIMDPEGGSFYRFIELWKESGALGEVFIQEMQEIIAEHFDKLISYESEKPEQ